MRFLSGICRAIKIFCIRSDIIVCRDEWICQELFTDKIESNFFLSFFSRNFTVLPVEVEYTIKINDYLRKIVGYIELNLELVLIISHFGFWWHLLLWHDDDHFSDFSDFSDCCLVCVVECQGLDWTGSVMQKLYKL